MQEAETRREDPGRALTGQEIARAASIVMLAFIFSGILGLIRQVVLTAAFGADRELDAFYAALRLPETLFTLVAGGALGSAFIPVFSRFLNQDDFNGAWRLASTILTLLIMMATLSAVLGFVFADILVERILVPGADAETQALTVELMRIMLVTVIIFGVSGLLMGILNAHQQFLTPALAPGMYNVGIIAGTLLLSPSMGVHGLAWGAVLGAGLHMGLQIPSVLRLPYRVPVRPAVALSTPGVQEVLVLMGPRIAGLMVVQLNFWVNVALASEMTPGSLAALTTAFTLMFTILGILGQSLGTAVFPTLSALYARQDMESFNRTFNQALSSVLFLSIPAGLGMVILADPIITFLFERGEWSSADTRATAWALMFYGIGLAGHATLEILARTYYALHDTWTPVLIGGAAMALNVVLSFTFVALFDALGADTFTRGPYGGLALANTLATALESAVLWFILWRRIPEMKSTKLMHTLSRTLIAGGGMVAVVALWLEISDGLATPFILLPGMLIGGGAFWGIALLLRVDEAWIVPRQILRRFKRAAEPVD